MGATRNGGPAGSIGELADLLGGESDRSRRFLGGLVAGALVGAAIAGSALVRRRWSGSPRQAGTRGGPPSSRAVR